MSHNWYKPVYANEKEMPNINLRLKKNTCIYRREPAHRPACVGLHGDGNAMTYYLTVSLAETSAHRGQEVHVLGASWH